MRAYWRLPEVLQIAAYSAGGEYAWPRGEALLVIEDLSRQGCGVIGIDLWLATEPGPTIPMPVYTWEAQLRQAAEPWSAFVRRVNTEAAGYVRDFSWDAEDKHHASSPPYFNLTVVEERER